MSTDPLDPETPGLPPDLLDAVCEGTPSTVLSALQRTAPTGDEAALREYAELAGELRAALRPEPLPARLYARLRAEFARAQPAARTGPWRPVRLMAVAAAAALALAWTGPLTSRPERTAPVTAGLSPQEAAEVVLACRLVQWNGHLDEVLERVSGDVAQLQQQVEEHSSRPPELPWEPAEDWDVPAPGESRSRTSDGPRAAAGEPSAAFAAGQSDLHS